jgi:release factor glutamine methyltransferase
MTGYAMAGERLWRAAWSRVFWWRFRLFQRHRHNRLTLEHAVGHPILVLPRVLNPTLFRTGEFLASCAASRIAPGSRVLDMGTGAGAGAIVAAARRAHVVAVDINPEAVRCTRINALLNRLEDRIEVREGDLFGPVEGERFDTILFNPPYLPGTPRDMLEHGFRGGDVIDRFAAQLTNHLTPTGDALVLLSTEADIQAALRSFSAGGLVSEPIAVRDLKSEVLTVFRICQPSTATTRDGT